LFAFREAGMQVSPVSMSCPSLNRCSTLFIKGPWRKKGDFYFGLLALALAFGFGIWLFGVGSFWKGKELLKGNC
jgi:hypothetical protein